MANYFLDNGDIQFHFKHLDLAGVATATEEGFRFNADHDSAPADAPEAIENYRQALTILGEITADFIAPRAEEVDATGCTLHDDGRVDYAPGTVENLDMLGKADMMGFTLPHRFGGLNFPNLVYSIAIELVSRADASLMNLFGLQGIAETIEAFADEEIKQEYLPAFTDAKVTGAMVLTEPDAGSDLQAVKLRATQNEDGQWRLNGVKRFITNGCGEVLLVLARSEADSSGGLGLSLLLCERGPWVRIRRLEEKLGIHGSPTCEMVFTDAPAKLIGERRRGLVTYVMALMNGARIGIGAQGVGIGQAALDVARDYAHSRVQFGTPIEQLPPVADMLIDMQIDVEAARTLLYETSYCVDLERTAIRKAEGLSPATKEEARTAKKAARQWRRITGMLTPMCKYYGSEMSQRVACKAIQVLGGSGYMRDYPLERLYRDARITTIYEGTSQLQIVATVLSIVSGTSEKYFTQLAEKLPADAPAEFVSALTGARETLSEVAAIAKEKGGSYRDLVARDLVDTAIDIVVGYLFSRDATVSKHKTAVAARWISRMGPRIRARAERIRSGEDSTLTQFDTFIGPPTPR